MVIVLVLPYLMALENLGAGEPWQSATEKWVFYSHSVKPTYFVTCSRREGVKRGAVDLSGAAGPRAKAALPAAARPPPSSSPLSQQRLPTLRLPLQVGRSRFTPQVPSAVPSTLFTSETQGMRLLRPSRDPKWALLSQGGRGRVRRRRSSLEGCKEEEPEEAPSWGVTGTEGARVPRGVTHR